MKATLLFLLFTITSLPTFAQDNFPQNWLLYTTDEYLYSVQSGIKEKDIAETEYLNYLENMAREELAMSIEVHVKSETVAHTRNDVVGESATTRSSLESVSEISTDLNLRMVETRSTYNEKEKRGYAIAYIHKETARKHYVNELNILLDKADNTLAISQNYINSGYKSKALSELENLLSEITRCEKIFSWLTIFNTPTAELTAYTDRYNALHKEVKTALHDLRHSTNIYISCESDIFGTSYLKLKNEIKGDLSAKGCNFRNDTSQADWVINITASSREYNRVQTGNFTTYYAYVDAQISIINNASGQCVFEDEIATKGGHTLNYSEAARDAYKKLRSEIVSVLEKVIFQ